MKIAIIGSRGVPAKYGGFETFAEEIGKRLAERGHDVYVYGRSSYYSEKLENYLGMNLIYLPDVKVKILETLLHSFLALLHAMRRRYDVFLILNCANSPLLVLPKLMGKKTALHVDGLEWKRDKWSSLGRRYYKFAEWFATKLSVDLISDSLAIQRYYLETYSKKTHFIPFGANLQCSRDHSLLRGLDLEPQDYFLQITRFEPENNPLVTVKAFEKLITDKKLVLVGGAKYRTKYLNALMATSDKRIRFLGYQYDKELIRELYCNCFSYIHGNEVGGTNPALLEAMASGCFVICRDVAFNREVLGEAGIYFDKDPAHLLKQLTWTLENEGLIQELKKKTREIIETNYNWDSVLEDYLDLFQID